ncbi:MULTISPECIES: FixH family protein [unclassified Arenibacter]|uniref:FixH family protein n=1 Tax=unclassified Arenibacter TaxID=2615047 RepID=UPI000E34F24A|nr:MULTISPECIES: FixH family protein [unclassified Arenibacter]MCM4162558.1 cytochrome C oxidase Cbb3 [Arenibacter sp. A80]RFT58136.1 cytochrome C oxidase Cbb3 [Arenibacter sp. P308M17]
MKINWGTGIVLAFIAFISFILFFVVRMSMDNKANHDLVTENYYRAELGYQNEIDAENNARRKEVELKLETTGEGVKLIFPNTLNSEDIKGTVSLYRPSNKHLDFEMPISLSQDYLLIPNNRLLDGRWDIKVSWKYQDEAYLYKKKISYHQNK